MIKLIEEFNNMDKLPMFEIEHNGEYYIYNIEINEEELTTECGISVELEEEQTLDYHLEGLYELCLEDAEEREGLNKSYLEKMLDEMNNGNWGTAQDLYKAINPNASEFSEAISRLSDEELKDIALLGFYCRDYVADDSIVNYDRKQI